jgi:uncharacterized protein (TIGR03437 family)
MMKTALCAVLFSAALSAQTADIAFFRAILSPANETPAVNLAASGMGDVVVHMVRDSSGNIISGSVDFTARPTFPVANTVTGMHIHAGAAGVMGPVTINSGISATNPAAVMPTGTVLKYQTQFTSTDTASLATINGMLDDPSQFYFNVHTTDFPGGAIRGQLQRATVKFLTGAMSNLNEVPPVTVSATGTAIVEAVGTFDANYNVTSGAVYLQTTYSIPEQGTFTGFHIHTGTAGTNGPVMINSGISSAIDPSGVGSVGPFYVEINPANAAQVTSFTNLFNNPSGDYINIHTNLHTGGVMRSQMLATDSNVFKILLDSANEPGTVNVKGTGPTQIGVVTSRNQDGTIAAGAVIFDVNYRLPSTAMITGLHIHDGPAGVNGPVTIPLIPAVNAPFMTATPSGNIFAYTPGSVSLTLLTDLLTNPENHYVNLHTTTDPAGTMRSQLAAPITAMPSVDAVISADNDKAATTVAPGGLVSIYGTNLVKVPATLAGWVGTVVPNALNGTSVTIGGIAAPLVYVSPTQINAEVPLEVAAGMQAVVVKSVVGPSSSFRVNVASTAPAIFFSPVAAVLKNADFSLVGSDNPAKAGDVLLVYCTGLGDTIPGLATGAVVSMTATPATKVAVTATVGGTAAPVAYAIASPGFVGLYQVAITVPAGVSGTPAIVLTQGTVKSNAVTIPVQ